MFIHIAVVLIFSIVWISSGPPRFEGGSRFGDRDGYRGGPRGPPGEFGGEKGGAPPDFQPSYRGPGGRPGFGRGGGGSFGAPPSSSFAWKDADAKFFVKDDIPSEVLLVKIPSMKFITRKDISSPKKGPKYGNDRSSESTSNSVRAEIATPSNSPPFLQYVPLSHHKNGQSPFAECLQSTEDMQRPPAKLTMEDVAILKENHVMPLTSSTNT